MINQQSRWPVTCSIRVISALILCIGSSPRVDAQSSQLTANVGAGLTFPTGQFSSETQVGMGINAGVGWRFGDHFATSLAFGTNALNVNSSAVLPKTPLGFTSIQTWSLTADPSIRFNTRHSVQPYVVCGYGLYSTRSSLSGRTVLKAGVNAGGGLNFRIDENASLYVEVRVNRVFVGGTDTNYVPVIFGFRWQ
ncbi:MAG: outer membrane beta-barrel protein [Bryobacteraceae bacterium]